ncbi:MAG: TonB-dependent receptor [Polaribacter sp.]|uniref:TonB-dependent receptor n=1 Tax=Polaribacter sp. TaxID=1920175 RepID=UPI002F35B780
MLKKYFFIVTLLCFFLNNFAQVKVKGKILDTKNAPLRSANVIAFPSGKGKLVFSVSNNKGEYSIELLKNISYNISISFMGYITRKVVLITPQEDTIINYTLHEDPNKLEEIVIKYKVPIKIKKDTTTYNVDAFTNGKERKLKQILKKLPGVEVDRKGNITVNGKKVTTLLVDNKVFFTGDTKLAVNNIPADVIDKIDVIEDYHENTFMKGLEKSDKVAMNINLKKDKKKFVFGDIETGLGIKERYLFHPAIFKYSPKINYSFIGDLNNTNKKSFSIRDYINFEGGLDFNNLKTVIQSPIVKLLRNQNFIKSNHKFGGFNLQWSKNEKTNWSSFLIALSDNTVSKVEKFRNYLVDDLTEKLHENEKNKQDLVLGRIQLLYKPNENTRIKYFTKFESTSVNQSIENNRDLEGNLITFNENNTIESNKVSSYFKAEKKFSGYHTSQAIVNLNFNKINDNNNWEANTNIFPNSINVDETKPINIFQNTSFNTFSYNAGLKHFWIIDNVNHLYFNIGNVYEQNNFKSNLLQNNIFFNGFKNNLNQNKFTIFSSIMYKKLIGNAILTTELKYQNYYRTTSQLSDGNSYKSNKILPKIELDWDISNRKKLTFKYNLTNSFPNTKQLISNSIFNNYNNIFIGNTDLKETFYHFFSLKYSKYRTYGWSFYPSLYYRLRNNQVQNIFNSTNIFNFINLININTPSKSFSSSFRIVYNYKYWKATMLTEYNNSSYARIINNNEVLSKDNSLTGRLTFRTMYEEKPNIDFSYIQTYNDNSNAFFNSLSNISKLDFVIDYEKGDWVFKTEYLYNFYKNNVSNTRNSYNEINASIFYQKENSPWGFEISGTNIGNNSSKVNSSLSSILFSETRRFVFPRTYVLKVIYKL